MGLHLLRDFAVGRVLLLFVRERGAIQVKKFRPVKADAFGAIPGRGFDFVGQLDVRRENDVPAIARG